jgi:hypothetical protein
MPEVQRGGGGFSMTEIPIGCRRNASEARLIPYLQEEEQIYEVCLLNTRKTQTQNTQRYVGRTVFLIKYVL